MNVEIIAVAVQFLFWEYLFKIFSIGSFQWTAQLNEKIFRLQVQAKHKCG